MDCRDEACADDAMAAFDTFSAADLRLSPRGVDGERGFSAPARPGGVD
jgi:hypothetical protein